MSAKVGLQARSDSLSYGRTDVRNLELSLKKAKDSISCHEATNPRHRFERKGPL
jgi:hypothetical protein